MATSKTFNNSTYSIPANREPRGWGTSLSAFLIDVADNALSKAGGNFTLTADVNFGTAYGIVSKYIKYSSGTLMINTSGVITVPNATDTLVGKATTDILTNKTLTSPVINTPTGIVKGDVGLGNVDNTSDANKPISTATQTALDLKANLASPTIVSPTIDNGMTMNHESTPATPSAGTVKVYPKSDNSLYVLDPNGVETQVGSGSGQGEKNYITNPSMKSATTGWSNVGDLDVARTTTASELPREYSTAAGIKITADSNTQSVADYVYFDFTLDDVDLSKKLKIQWSQKLFGAYTAGQLAVVITTQADRTTALHTPVTTAIPAVSNDFTTSFDAGTTATLSLVIRATGDMTTDTGIVISDVVVGPGIITQGAAVSEWASYSTTIFGGQTGGTQTARWRRVGSSMELEATIDSPSAWGIYQDVTLPTGYTINTSSLTLSKTAVGTALTRVNNSSAWYAGSVTVASTTTVRPGGAGTQVDMWAASISSPAAYTANQGSTSIHVTVPIAEWAGSGTVNLGAGAQVEYAYNTSSATTGDDSTSFGYGPTGAQIVNITAAGKRRVRFQYPIQDGDILEVQVKKSATAPWVVLDHWDPSTGLQPYQVQSGGAAYGLGIDYTAVNSTDVDVLFGTYCYASGATLGAAGSAWSGANAFKWRVRKVSASSPVGFGLAGTDGSSGLYKPGQAPGLVTGAAIASGYVGETVEGTQSTATNYPTNNTYGDGTSVTLTAGKWALSLIVVSNLNGSTVTIVECGITTTSGNSSSGLSFGSNAMDGVPPTSAYSPGMTIPNYIVNISSTTTYYAKVLAGYSAGNPQYRCRLTAIRIA